ncbi:hypothetical protein MTR67_052515 [Solanum verrucosum]|nr:hypothetical protein MTR67_052515 [Solanum verrucosum]
MLLMLRG